MSLNRDPRTDPRPGDVVMTKAGELRHIVAVDVVINFGNEDDGYSYEDIALWREEVANARVLHAAPEAE